MKQISRKNTLRGAGHIWHASDDWETNITDRIKVLTWKFGEIHQCKVFIRYADGHHPIHGDRVGICLMAQPTRLEAMKHGVEWAEHYIETGPPTVEQVFSDCYNHWPTIYRTRVDVIDHLFFTNGNGYEWLDGAIQCTGPDDYIESQRREEYRRTHPTEDEIREKELFSNMLKKHKEKPYLSDDMLAIINDMLDIKSKKERAKEEGRPLPDDGTLRNFYPVSQDFAEITRVPDDVRPDWLALSYEAALMLRDRSAPDNPKNKGQWNEKLGSRNIQVGSRIVKELERRFPQLKGHEIRR